MPRARGMCVCRSGLFAPDGLGLSQPADTLSVRELELRLGRNRQQPTSISGITAVEAIVPMNAISGRGLGGARTGSSVSSRFFRQANLRQLRTLLADIPWRHAGVSA